MIGYYVHHHGSGHARRAAVLSRYWKDEVVGFGSGGRPADWNGGGWIDLPLDVAADGFNDVSAQRNGAWHWAPHDLAGFAERMRLIAGWIGETAPEAFVVDVSTELTVLTALLGVPTAMVLLPGQRDDRPHLLAADSSDLVIAPWSVADLEGEGGWRFRLGDRLAVTGGFGRFDNRSPVGEPIKNRVVAIVGNGGSDGVLSNLCSVVDSTPTWSWHFIGVEQPLQGAVVHGWLDDPFPLLCSADVVVTACGDASLSEVAAARRPAVLCPQTRPFDEQRAAAEQLIELAAPVELAPGNLGAQAWEWALQSAAQKSGADWANLYDGGGAQRFAESVLSLSLRSRNGRALV